MALTPLALGLLGAGTGLALVGAGIILTPSAPPPDDPATDDATATDQPSSDYQSMSTNDKPNWAEINPHWPNGECPYEHEPHRDYAEMPAVGGAAAYDPDAFDPDAGTHGAGWPTAGESVDIDDADRVVVTRDQLRQAVNTAPAGAYIWVPGTRTLDVTGLENLTPAKNVTIASDRGQLRPGEGYSPGAHLVARHHPQPLFKLLNAGVRVSGLRITLPQLEHQEFVGYDVSPVSTAIAIDALDVEVDNCQIRGCAHAAIEVGRHSKGENIEPHIHHCALVDNPMGGLGYGVTTFHGLPLIQYTYFDNNRHSIEGDGAPDCGYIARYNFAGEHTGLHVFGMHRHSEVVEGGGDQAGKRISIHHNVIKATKTRGGHNAQAVRFRGVPLEGGQVVHNWFAHDHSPKPGTAGNPEDAVLVNMADSFADAGVDVSNNLYSPEPAAESVGVPRSLGSGGGVPDSGSERTVDGGGSGNAESGGGTTSDGTSGETSDGTDSTTEDPGPAPGTELTTVDPMSITFDESDWKAAFQDRYRDGGLSIIEPGRDGSGGALRVNCPKGSNYGCDIAHQYAEANDGTEPEQAHATYWMFFPESFEMDGDGKLPGFAGTYGRAGWGGRAADGTNGWSARVGMSTNENGVNFAWYCYHAEMNEWGDWWWWDKNNLMPIARGEWHRIDQFVKLNTPGENDGTLRGWIDGELAGERTGVRFRDTSDLKIERFWCNVYHGGSATWPQSTHVRLDELTLAARPPDDLN